MTVLLLVPGGGPLPVADFAARRWMVREPVRWMRRWPLQRGQAGRRRGPRLMWPVPLHLGQGPNGRRYSRPAQMAAPAMMARIR
jgi:hypothetical protein